LFSSIERGERERLCSRNREERFLPDDKQDGGHSQGCSQPECLPAASQHFEAEGLFVYASSAQVSKDFWD